MPTPSTLDCPSGHPVKKYKRPKPWQGWVQGARCGVCGIEFERHDFRWRCEEHCNYNVCTDCFSDYYMNLIAQATAESNQKRRNKMLSAIPDFLRATQEYEAAESNEPPPEPEANGKAKKAKGSKKPRGADSAQARCGSVAKSCGKMQVVLWVVLWLVGMMILTFSTRALLLDEDLAFPNSLLMVGLSHIPAFVICQLTVIFSNCCVRLGTNPEWKASGVFGLLHCLQASLSGGALRCSEMYHDSISMVSVVAFFSVAVCQRSETPNPISVFSTVLAAAGGVLVVSGRGRYTLTTLQNFDVIGFEIFSILAGCLRLGLAFNFLKQDVSYAYGKRMPRFSPTVLAARMCPPTAIASIELATILDFGCWDRVMQSAQKGKILRILCVIGFGNAVKLLAELHLLRLSSVAMLGLLVPCSAICATIAPRLLQGSGMPSLVLIGALVYAAAIALFLLVRFCPARRTPASLEDYARLEDGAGYAPRPPKGKRPKAAKVLAEPHTPREPRPGSPSEGGRNGPKDWI